MKNDIAIVIGCGNFGTQVVKTLSFLKKNIIVIDKNYESFSKLPSNFSGFTLEGNGLDVDSLLEASIDKASILITTTNDDNSNLMIAQIAKYIYKVPTVIARIFDTNKSDIYSSLGIETINPTILLAEKFNNILEERGENR